MACVCAVGCRKVINSISNAIVPSRYVWVGELVGRWVGVWWMRGAVDLMLKSVLVWDTFLYVRQFEVMFACIHKGSRNIQVSSAFGYCRCYYISVVASR